MLFHQKIAIFATGGPSVVHFLVHILLVKWWPTDGKVLDTLCICVATVGYEWQNMATTEPLLDH